jgi:hypothetical protein
VASGVPHPNPSLEGEGLDGISMKYARLGEPAGSGIEPDRETVTTLG